MVVRSFASPNLADAANLTDQMTAGSGTFIGTTGFDEVDGAAGGNSLDIVASGQAQVEYCVQIRSVDVRSGGSVRLRVSDSQGNLATWTQIPTIPLSPITVSISDPWETLSDTNGLAYERTAQSTPLTPPEQVDTWGTLADAIQTERYWDVLFDSVVYDRQSLAETTPIERPLAADPWENLGDQPATVFRTGALRINLAADPWANLADQPPTIDERGNRFVDLSNDPWLNLADQPPTVDERGILRIALDADPASNWLDDRTVNRQDITATPIERPLAQDPWGNLADQPPTIDERGILLVSPSADPMAMTDQPVTVDERGLLRINLSADPMVMADVEPPTVSRQDISATPKNYPLDADPNVAYTDAVSGRGHGYNLTGDTLSLLDQAPTVAMTGRYQFDLTADNLNQWVDDRQVASGGDLRYSLTPDNLANYADSLKQSKSYRLPADDLKNYTDEVDDLILAKRLDLTSDPWANLADQPVTVARPGSITRNLTADPMTMGDQPPTIVKTTLKAPTLPADAFPAYGERLSIGLGVAESWGNLDDSMRLGWAFRFTGDAMTMADQPVQLSAGGALLYNLPVDSMTMADGLSPQYAKNHVLAADQMTMGDDPVIYAIGYVLALADTLDAYADALEPTQDLSMSVSDAAPVYADEVTVQRIGELIAALAEANGDYGDELTYYMPSFDQKYAQLVDGLANWQDVTDYVEEFYGLHLHGKSIDQVSLSGKSRTQIPLGGKSGEELDISSKTFTGEI